MKKIKILILTMEAGLGHKIPAMAVCSKLKELDKNCEVEVLDVAAELSCELLDKSYKKIWSLMLKRPWLLKPVYFFTNNNFIDSRLAESALALKLDYNLYYFLLGYKPDLVFHTHYTSANSLGRLKKKKKVDIKDVVLITDPFEIHPIWLSNNNDFYLIGTDRDYNSMVGYGVDVDKIKKIDYPLRSIFKKWRYSSSEVVGIKNKLGISVSKLSVLLFGGGEGVGDVFLQVQKIIENNLNISLVVICGKNKKLYDKLLSLKSEGCDVSLHVYGFVDNMDEFIAQADLVMGKSGGSSVFEVLFMKKPFLITHCMDNEKGSKEFILENRLGWYETRIFSQIQILSDIVYDRSILSEIKKNYKKVDFKNGSFDVAKFLLNYAKNNKTI
jgi:processive 1,2-diacylglycerol beta-glucosyltransferase